MTTNKAIEMIAKVCTYLGWTIAIPKIENIPYLILGEEEIVKQITKYLESGGFSLENLPPKIKPSKNGTS